VAGSLTEDVRGGIADVEGTGAPAEADPHNDEVNTTLDGFVHNGGTGFPGLQDGCVDAMPGLAGTLLSPRENLLGAGGLLLDGSIEGQAALDFDDAQGSYRCPTVLRQVTSHPDNLAIDAVPTYGHQHLSYVHTAEHVRVLNRNSQHMSSPEPTASARTRR